MAKVSDDGILIRRTASFKPHTVTPEDQGRRVVHVTLRLGEGLGMDVATTS
jgi:hypothetical protein